MKQVAMIPFNDIESRDAGFALVRAKPGCVALTLSLESDGDIEVIMPAADCELLIRALEEAVKRLTSHR